MGRWLIALLALVSLGGLLYLQQGGSDSTTGDTVNGNPGFIAIGASLIETGADGQPLYRLDADRIEQPQPEGTVFLTAPKLHYQPVTGDPWTLTANTGQMPQDASSADLSGSVHAEGKPGTSNELMRIDTEQLHIDMRQQVATSHVGVRVHWSGYQLRANVMRADLKNDTLQMSGNGYATQVR